MSLRRPEICSGDHPSFKRSMTAAQSVGVKQDICINWGTKYGAPFINRLYAMVTRNITPPFTFTCFTDSRAGLNSEILCEDLPPLEIENMPINTKGIWPKARLWGPALGSLKGPVLFLDLDLVIVSSLDPFFEVGGADDVVMTRNQTTPFERLGQTSLFRFPVGKLPPLQEKFRAYPQGVADEYRYRWGLRSAKKEEEGRVSIPAALYTPDALGCRALARVVLKLRG